MLEAQQLALLEIGKPEPKGPVEYVPPAPAEIDQYVHAVCQQLTQKEGRTYTDTDFVHGLTNFLQVVVQIQTRHLNQGVKNVQ